MKTINNPLFYISVLVLGLFNNARHLYSLYSILFFNAHTTVLEYVLLIVSLLAIESTIFVLTIRGEKYKALAFAIGTGYMNAHYMLYNVVQHKDFNLYSDAHKFLPAIVWAAGFALIVYYFSDFLAEVLRRENVEAQELVRLQTLVENLSIEKDKSEGRLIELLQEKEAAEIDLHNAKVDITTLQQKNAAYKTLTASQIERLATKLYNLKRTGKEITTTSIKIHFLDFTALNLDDDGSST